MSPAIISMHEFNRRKRKEDIMIKTEIILHEIEKELKKANIIINNEVKKFVDSYNGPFSYAIKENYKLAEKECLPLCQDTGFIEFFVFLGHKITLEDPIDHILQNAVRKVYTENPFRYSMVSDPIFDRKNTGDNTPPIIHLFQVEGKKLEIRFLVKGGGSENLTKLCMLKPSSDVEEIKKIVIDHIKENAVNSCPPLHVGIGIGGSSEKALLNSKLALTKSFYEKNKDPTYAKLEKEILSEINYLKIGFQGLGKGITAYAVHIEYSPTHIATLPLAISVDCYLCRRGKIVIEDR